MRGSVKSSRGRTKKGLQIGLLRELAKAVATQGVMCLVYRGEGYLVENASGVADEVDANPSGRLRFDHGPVLLEHFDDLYPEVCALDRDGLVHLCHSGSAG